MKKLMVALVAGAMAMGASAASMAWNCEWNYSLNDEKGVDTFDTSCNMTYWVVALSSDSTAGISVDADGKLTLGEGMAVKGDPGAMIQGGGGDLVDLGFKNNGDYYTLVVYDAKNGLYGISDVQQVSGFVDPGDKPQQNSGDTMVFSNDKGLNDDETPYMMANLAVAPEPTSGLLLLLGVAGLALKRKRA